MTSLEQRFWAKVDKSDGCWLWTAAAIRGYGRIMVDGKTRIAHRVSWELTNGPVPGGLCVCHRCDVPACCNPSHLFLGTNAENLADMKAKGRGVSSRGETNGRAKLTAAQVVEVLAATGILRVIAARFGVSQQQVHRIRAGQRWAHLLCRGEK